jgi:hypothetical protein
MQPSHTLATTKKHDFAQCCFDKAARYELAKTMFESAQSEWAKLARIETCHLSTKVPKC